MKNIKHTPGPWVVGETIALRHTVLGNGNNSVCKAFGETENESHANAALISAAPEMLEALATIYNFANLQPLLETRYSKALVSDLMKQMQNAIAKAEGE